MAKPLTIAVQVDDKYNLPNWVRELMAAGHHIVPLDELNCETIMGNKPTISPSDCDLILGPTCCRFVPGMEKFLPAIIKGVRAVKYPKKEKA